MRILLVGQVAFAEEVLRGLEAAGDTIAAVVCPPDAGPKPDPVKAAALARGIPVHQFRSLKAPEARHAFAEARADLGVLAYVTQIVPEPLLHIPRLTRAGKGPRVPQVESHAGYDPPCRDGHARIDWSRPAAEVHNLIRGCDPQPGAHTTWRGARLRLYAPRRVEALAGAPAGTVLAIGADGLTVAARDGAICCARARDGGAKAA